MSTRRPSTGATSTAAHTASELFHASSAHKKELEMACVKNLIGALTTNGHKLKPPGESGVGIFFVFHDLRCVIGMSVRYWINTATELTGLRTFRLCSIVYARRVLSVFGCAWSLLGSKGSRIIAREHYSLVHFNRADRPQACILGHSLSWLNASHRLSK